MDASALELIQIYRQRAATWQAAYERMSAENLELRQQLDRLRNPEPRQQCQCQLCE